MIRDSTLAASADRSGDPSRVMNPPEVTHSTFAWLPVSIEKIRRGQATRLTGLLRRFPAFHTGPAGRRGERRATRHGRPSVRNLDQAVRARPHVRLHERTQGLADGAGLAVA